VILVLGDLLDIDIDAAYSQTMGRIEERLTQSIARVDGGSPSLQRLKSTPDNRDISGI
jgi:hypothetical protein